MELSKSRRFKNMHISATAHKVMAEIGQYTHAAYKSSVVLLHASICLKFITSITFKLLKVCK